MLLLLDKNAGQTENDLELLKFRLKPALKV